MGLKHLPFVSIVFLLLSILTRITLGGESLSGRFKVPWLLVEGQRKMLANFAMVIGVVSFPGTWQNNLLFDVPLSHSNHKRNLWKEYCTHLFCG